MPNTIKTTQGIIRNILIGIFLLTATMETQAAGLTLAIQPIMPEAQTRAAYQPLIDYLQQITGEPVQLVTSPNFLVYWQLMQRKQWDLVFDAAHFTDYRVEKAGYKVLAKLPDTVSYTLATHPDLMVLETADLIGKRVASLPSPGLGAARLQEIFPNPMRQPEIIEAADADEAAALVESGKADAAMLPTRMLSVYTNLVPVYTTRAVPAPALSASPSLPPALRKKIQQAMLDAGKSSEGQAMFKAINLPPFVSADNRLYTGHGVLLANTWGY